MEFCKVYEKGRVTIPKQFRDEMGIDVGDYVLIRKRDDKISIEHVEAEEG